MEFYYFLLIANKYKKLYILFSREYKIKQQQYDIDIKIENEGKYKYFH